MECNKEEAIRAKEIAEKRMISKDFPGALKIVLRAQRLYHDLENISQMLMICEVHCAAEKRIFGNEMDWYGILQIEQTVDEATIKKQYRKFALLLHPDKNKFPGAEAAFKLIGEAQRVLLDQSKRSSYDMKRRVTLGRQAPTAAARQPQGSSWNPHVTAQTNFRTNFPSSTPQQKQPRQQSQQPHSNGRPTFWTKCPYCKVRYQYYTDILHGTLRCQTCDKSFIAYDLGAAPQATDSGQLKVPKQKDVQNQGAQNVKQGFHENLHTENSKAASSLKAAHDSNAGMENANGKRGRKRSVESSGSCDTQSRSGSEDVILIDESSIVQAGKDFKSPKGNLRRSGRCKQAVSHRENLSDNEDFVNPPKRGKGSSSFNATEEDGDTQKEESLKINDFSNAKREAEKVFGQETAEDGDPKKCSEGRANGGKMNFNADSKSNLSPQSSQEPDLHSYPDPDFNDFDKDRKEEIFAVGQIWAAYDTLDAMPRFYVRIRRVFSPGFKLRITWLEPVPDDVNEMKWVDEGLPVSCGKFKYGDSENTEDHLMFSHLMYCEKGKRRDTFKVFPRKGETWALFKNWDIEWNSDAVSNRKFEYEFVEILSEYADGAGIHVACLVKVKGFVSLFCRMVKDGIDVFQIPPGELFRFSHRVPSFKLTGMERKGVPKGSFELDPASLATNLEEIAVPEDLCSRSPGKVKRKMDSEKSNDKQGLEVDDVPQNSVDVNGEMNSRIPKEVNHSDRSDAVLPASVEVDFTLHKSPKDKPNPLVCIAPVNCATPINAASPVCMDNEYLTLSCKKKLSRTSLLCEIRSHNPSDLEPISPLNDTRKRKDLADIRVMFSDHLDDDIIKQQRKILVHLGIPEVFSIIDATHFITDKFVRTRNMLEAMASGKPVVTHLWLESVGQVRKHIDEETYLLRDIIKEKEFGFCMPVSLAHARKHPLLEGRRVFITPNTKPGKDVISSLVKAVHGRAVERIGRSVLKDDKIPDDMLVLTCEEDYALCVPFLEKGAAVYSTELLLNGIVTQRLEYERHRLFAEQVKRTRSTIFLKRNDKFLPVTKLK